MGNGQGREAREGGRRHHHHGTTAGSSSRNQDTSNHPAQTSPSDATSPADRSASLGVLDRDATQPEQRRETRQEREARKLEKERALRAEERERSLKTEGIDGGFLVTLGVYTGPEDFSKSTVRQLQIERRLAPFWKGLNDHEDSWAEHQLVAAARGLPIPPADEIPPELVAPPDDPTKDIDTQKDMLPITARSQSVQSEASETRSTRSRSGSGFGFASCHPGPLFRARAKTLASLTTTSRSNSTTQLAPQEIQLPPIARVNGQLLEAYLYKDASECPICFLYYPPYLNKTRCCDQPICSECFVQIKRPDPHPPEHHVPANNNSTTTNTTIMNTTSGTGDTGDAPSDIPADQQQPPPASEESAEQSEQLVSEPSQCPFCKTPDFGVTYEPPSFRSGLIYTGSSPAPPASQPPLHSDTPGMTSTTSLTSTGNRRRTTSLSAAAPSVITTDRIRPDWAKKLSDARAHALRRSAAATALHNAAYVLGASQQLDPRFQAFGRRRRTLFGDIVADSPTGAGGDGTEQGARRASGTRRSRAQDLEELMMMEAIRLSLASEEERKKKEDKETKKQEKQQAKEQAKQAAKDAKEAKKEAKKASKAGNLYSPSANTSTSTWASGQQNVNNGSSANQAGSAAGSAPATPGWPLPTAGKGKGPMTGGPIENPQGYLNDSRTSLQPPSPASAQNPANSDAGAKPHARQFSSASSIASSIIETPTGSFRNESGFITAEPGPTDTRSSTPQVEPMLNFQSLAAMIGTEDKNGQHIEHVEQVEPETQPESRPSSSREQSPGAMLRADRPTAGSRSRGNSGASRTSGVPQAIPEDKAPEDSKSRDMASTGT